MSLRIAAKYVSRITHEEYVLLSLTEKYSRKYRKVPVEELKKRLPFSDEYISLLIRRLVDSGLIQHFKEPYESAVLLSRGLDVLALKRLTDKGIVAGVGRCIGVGKEADIYEVVDGHGNRLSVKVYRLGRVSFKKIMKHRSYAFVTASSKWIARNYIAAKREYMYLTKLYNCGVSVPKPLCRVMHMIAMEIIDGWPLVNIIDIDNPYEIFHEIIDEIIKAWNCGVVNGDLNEYNIFLTKDEYKPVLIDWPQATSRDDRSAVDHLIGDMYSVGSYFIKRYECESNKIMSFIKDVLIKNEIPPEKVEELI
ncbi:MAG: RIO1 family regulatory kinase/ATPase [Candidatus Geothermarchaeota archaeon]